MGWNEWMNVPCQRQLKVLMKSADFSGAFWVQSVRGLLTEEFADFWSGQGYPPLVNGRWSSSIHLPMNATFWRPTHLQQAVVLSGLCWMANLPVLGVVILRHATTPSTFPGQIVVHPSKPNAPKTSIRHQNRHPKWRKFKGADTGEVGMKWMPRALRRSMNNRQRDWICIILRRHHRGRQSKLGYYQLYITRMAQDLLIVALNISGIFLYIMFDLSLPDGIYLQLVAAFCNPFWLLTLFQFIYIYSMFLSHKCIEIIWKC